MSKKEKLERLEYEFSKSWSMNILGILIAAVIGYYVAPKEAENYILLLIVVCIVIFYFFQRKMFKHYGNLKEFYKK
jgi:hypothetical protein